MDKSKTFNVNLTREGLYQRGMKQWARQKQASPKNPLRVSFIGEQGIDEGALRREFLTEMIRGLEEHLFEGDGKKGKNPKYSISDYQEKRFNVVQGGPAPNFFSPWSYNFLCHGHINNDCVVEVTDSEISNLIKQVDSDFICQAMCPQFSDQGSLRRQKETKIINFLQDFLQSLDDQAVLECQNGSPSEDFESKKLSAKIFSVGVRPGTCANYRHST